MDAGAAVETLYRSDWGRIVATLIRLVGDFDLAEEVAQEAFAAAIDRWRDAGVPEFPRAWIIQTARYKAVDRQRRQARLSDKLEAYSTMYPSVEEFDDAYASDEIPDDRLRLIFTCCHPALALEARLDADGVLVLLDQQDRSRWNRAYIAEALPLVEEAFSGGPGPFALQAAIAAVHCQAARAEETDWPRIVRLYDVLERVEPSP